MRTRYVKLKWKSEGWFPIEIVFTSLQSLKKEGYSEKFVSQLILASEDGKHVIGSFKPLSKGKIAYMPLALYDNLIGNSEVKPKLKVRLKNAVQRRKLYPHKKKKARRNQRGFMEDRTAQKHRKRKKKVPRRHTRKNRKVQKNR